MSGASEVPAIPEDVKMAAGTVVMWLKDRLTVAEVDALFTDIINTILADRLARPVDTGREKAPSAADRRSAAVEAFRVWFFQHTGKRIFHTNAGKAVDVVIRALANPENGRG